jgi:hypothetical protein
VSSSPLPEQAVTASARDNATAPATHRREPD